MRFAAATRYAPAGDADARPSRRPVASLLALRLPKGTWPLLPLPPAVVIVVGLAVALAVGMTGVFNLARGSDRQAGILAEFFAKTLAARLSQLPEVERLGAMQLAARKTGTEVLVINAAGRVVLDASLGLSDPALGARVARERAGEATTGLGRVRFAAAPLDAGRFVAAFVREPRRPDGEAALLRALVALTTLLVGVATGVAYAVARDVKKDIDFVTRRVRGMTHVRSEPAGEAVPVRTMDEVGALTVAFNTLVDRFAAAQSDYQADLERVKAADRDRAAFLAAVSHELRSPLNAILGFADILMAEVDGPLDPAAREEVDQIRGSGKHLLDLINDILELSALESGQLRLARARVDLWAVAWEVVREAAVLVGARPVSVRVRGEARVYARGDPRRVRQMLTNLVGNAVKFTLSGEVVVSIGREVGAEPERAARVWFGVKDTGPGIGDQEQALIFQEYKQSKAERSRRRGTGLGLAITQRLVTMHGGSIQLESELGRGSTFRVFLPAWQDGRERERERELDEAPQ